MMHVCFLEIGLCLAKDSHLESNFVYIPLICTAPLSFEVAAKILFVAVRNI